VYMLWMFQRVNYGPVTNQKNEGLPDLTGREAWILVPTIAMAILMGVLPGPFLRPMAPSVDRVIERVDRGRLAMEGGRGSFSPGAPLEAMTPILASGQAASHPDLSSAKKTPVPFFAEPES